MSVDGPPLGLSVEIAEANGTTTRWDSNATRAENRPQGISFNTKRGDGFADASCSLTRRIDGEYVDLGLLRDFTILGEDGSVAYEGRVTGLPRSMNGTHSINVQAAGWMSHTTDRKFREIYVDRDLTKWTGPSLAQQIRLQGFAFVPGGPETLQDPTGGQPCLMTRIQDKWGTNNIPRIEGWYDGAGVLIGSLYYAWKQTVAFGIGFDWMAALNTTAEQGTEDATPDLEATGPSSGTITATGPRTFAHVRFVYATNNAAGGDKSQYSVYWTCLAVYGNHGLTKSGTASATSAQGFTVSDMVRNIAARFAPKLNTAGVQDTTYVVEQAAFTDAITPYDAITQLNAFHRWNLSVWENKTLTYAPVDLTDYDWQVRLGDHGVTVDLQGDSAQNLANGIAVDYTDVVTGKRLRLDPDANPELADATVENPVNLAGLKVWTEIAVGFPCTQAMALQLGRAALAEFNAPKAPGTIKVQGHIRDRAGHLQPAWKVRADDRISITNYANDRPRLIVETSYSHDERSVSISVDAPAQRLEAVLDRIQQGLGAGGLS